MPKVSVVSGFYNRGHLLERTVHSIADQTFKDYEFLLFDDASTDGTAKKMSEFHSLFAPGQYKPIVFEQNVGFVNGLIDAIERSSGEYIAIQGSGDVSLSERLERQSEYMDSNPEVGVVGCWYYNVSEGVGVRRLRTPVADQVDQRALLAANIFSHGEVMIRRSVYERAGGYRSVFKFAQDYDLWLRIARTAKFGTVQEALYERYVQLDGVSYDPSKVVEQSCYSVAARRLSQLPEPDESVALDRFRSFGPEAVVDRSDAAVQKKVRTAAIRSLFFGSRENAEAIVDTGIARRSERVALRLAIGAISTPWAAPVRTVASRKLGIDRV
ncbi:glycosyltransferase [Gordonia amicalis]|uniref:glycosyltransferase n=1 Tax=Gordonia amicalis TaxID=89053 RepID=UPI00387DC0DB